VLNGESHKEKAVVNIIIHAVLFTFFLQLLTDFIESIYALGLLGSSIPVEILASTLFFSPILLLIARKGIPAWGILALAELVVLARALEVVLDTRLKLMVSGIGVAAFLIYLPALLWDMGKEQHLRKKSSAKLGASLLLSAVTLTLLRAINSGVDISTGRENLWLGWITAAAAAALLIHNYRRESKGAGRDIPPAEVNSTKPVSFSRIAGLSVGVCAVFLLFYFAFANPNVIVRWSAADYLGVMVFVFISYALFAVLMASSWFRGLLRPGVVWIWNAVFVFSLALTILAQQIQFPQTPSSYPLNEPLISPYAYIPLAVMILLAPVLVVDFYLYVRDIIHAKASLPSLGGGFTLGAFFMLLMVFANIFTTVYDYIPLVGPLLRDKFWLVHLIAGAALIFPLLLVNEDSYDFGLIPVNRKNYVLFFGYIVLAGLFSIYSINSASSLLTASNSANETVRLLTYNIRQGYSADGTKNYTGQLGLIRSLDPDIIGLQESDTNRISGGNTDIVRYFADNLDMYAYYGPKTVTGTFGIALLSKYPILNPRTFYMYSAGEQTAGIHARVKHGGEVFNIYVTHLGNGGPIIQQEAILKETAGQRNVILMGDFNFKTGTPQYSLTVESLEDAWLLRWPSGQDDQGNRPVERIDHIFLTPGLSVEEASYLEHPASDHPAVMVFVSK